MKVLKFVVCVYTFAVDRCGVTAAPGEAGGALRGTRGWGRLEGKMGGMKRGGSVAAWG